MNHGGKPVNPFPSHPIFSSLADIDELISPNWLPPAAEPGGVGAERIGGDLIFVSASSLRGSFSSLSLTDSNGSRREEEDMQSPSLDELGRGGARDAVRAVDEHVDQRVMDKAYQCPDCLETFQDWPSCRSHVVFSNVCLKTEKAGISDMQSLEAFEQRCLLDTGTNRKVGDSHETKDEPASLHTPGSPPTSMPSAYLRREPSGTKMTAQHKEVMSPGTNERYVCPECSQRFKDWEAFRLHIASDCLSSRRRYVCPECKEVFHLWDECRSHIVFSCSCLMAEKAFISSMEVQP